MIYGIHKTRRIKLLKISKIFPSIILAYFPQLNFTIKYLKLYYKSNNNYIIIIIMSIYVVIDVEFDGPQPGLNSMISLGAVAINKNGVNFGDFEINFGSNGKLCIRSSHNGLVY